MIALLCLLAQAEPPNDIGRGPLHMTSMSPFQTLRSGFTPSPPSHLAGGDCEFRVTESWANLWAFNEGDILIDMEILHTNIAIGRGLGAGFRADVELEASSRFGGSMDGLIDGTHDIIGAETRHREDFSNDDFAMNLQGRDGRPSARLTNRDRGVFSRSLVGTLQWTFAEGGPGGPALSAAVSFRTDLGRNADLRGGSPVDVAIAFSAAERWGPFLFSASAQAAWYGSEKFQDIPLEPIQAVGLAAIEWPFHKEVSVLLQYMLCQGAAEDWRDLSKPSHEILLGVKAEIGSRTVFEAGLLENLGIPDNSPDFGFHAGLSYRF